MTRLASSEHVVCASGQVPGFLQNRGERVQTPSEVFLGGENKSGAHENQPKPTPGPIGWAGVPPLRQDPREPSFG